MNKNIKQYYKTDKWNTIRKRVLKRDKYTCQRCGAKNKILQVHHLTYVRLGKERLSDLITLCKCCHAKKHLRSCTYEKVMIGILILSFTGFVGAFIYSLFYGV